MTPIAQFVYRRRQREEAFEFRRVELNRRQSAGILNSLKNETCKTSKNSYLYCLRPAHRYLSFASRDVIDPTSSPLASELKTVADCRRLNTHSLCDETRRFCRVGGLN